MIAPLRPEPEPEDIAAGGLITARRAVASALLKKPIVPAPANVPRVAALLAWAFTAFAVAVAASYLMPRDLWKIQRY